MIKNRYAVIIAVFLSLNSFSIFAAEYANPAKAGKVAFDYSDNDGRYFIGSGDAMFEIDFSGASNNAIHVYNDPKSIEKIALAYDVFSFSKIGDARKLNYTSRVRTVYTNEIVVLVNKAGYYAAVKVGNVKSRSHGAKRDKITFSYHINGHDHFFR